MEKDIAYLGLLFTDGSKLPVLLQEFKGAHFTMTNTNEGNFFVFVEGNSKFVSKVHLWTTSNGFAVKS